MRKLGDVQLNVLRSYYQHGYFPGGSWVWDNYSNTLRITLSLAKRGLVEQVDLTYKTRTMLGEMTDTVKVWKITGAGRNVIRAVFPNIEAFMPR